MRCWQLLAGIQDGNILIAGRVQEAWQRVKDDTAWMVPLVKFLLGSASFLVWWAAFRHWLPNMCSSRKQFWRTLRSGHSLYTPMHLLPHMSFSCKQFWRTLGSGHSLCILLHLLPPTHCPSTACAHSCTCGWQQTWVSEQALLVCVCWSAAANTLLQHSRLSVCGCVTSCSASCGLCNIELGMHTSDCIPVACRRVIKIIWPAMTNRSHLLGPLTTARVNSHQTRADDTCKAAAS